MPATLERGMALTGSEKTMIEDQAGGGAGEDDRDGAGGRDGAGHISPFRRFDREQWSHLRGDTPLTLTPEEVARLSSLDDRLSMDEVVAVYLPLSRLLGLYVHAAQELFRSTQAFLGITDRRIPFIIGIGGSVAVGKSTTARILQALLSRWPGSPHVDLVTTDGFLQPMAELERRGLMRRKGFPESYDLPALLRFLSRVKSGEAGVEAPVYSHLTYDILPDRTTVVDRPDILILEGLNVLQAGTAPRDGQAIPFVSDFFDFAIYVDADRWVIERWYVDRFMRLRDTAFRDPRSHFQRYARLSEGEAIATALELWRSINLVNLEENILPTRLRADLILVKDEGHRIAEILLRRL